MLNLSAMLKWHRSPPSVPLLGRVTLGLSCFMTFCALMSLAMARITGMEMRGPSLMPFDLPRAMKTLAAAQAILGILVAIISLRFLQLRRWTRLPLVGFAGLITLWIVAFAGFWVWSLNRLFADDGLMPKAIAWSFQILMTLGGLLVSAMFFIGAWGLLQKLRSPHVREIVCRSGF